MLNDPFAKLTYARWTAEMQSLSDLHQRSETALGMAFIAYLRAATANKDNPVAAELELVMRERLLEKVSAEGFDGMERGFAALMRAGELAIQMGDELRLQFDASRSDKQIELVIREIPADDNPLWGEEEMMAEEGD